MATTRTIGGNGLLFVGEDKVIRLELLVAEFDADGESVAPSASSVPVDMTGWVVKLDVRKADTATVALFDKTGVLEGVYNPVRATNTQRMAATFTDTELNTVRGQTYRYSWKRMDDGSETVLARGPFVVEKATAP